MYQRDLLWLSVRLTRSHGLGDTAHGWIDSANDMGAFLPYVKFVLPTGAYQYWELEAGGRASTTSVLEGSWRNTTSQLLRLALGCLHYIYATIAVISGARILTVAGSCQFICCS